MIRVMVVEDEPPILRTICSKITSLGEGYEVVGTASNGREALDYLSEKPEIDVIFVDINLPIINGLELLQFIKEKQLPIIPVVLSGYKDFDYVKRAYANSVVDYLLKPLDNDELKNLLERIKEMYHTQQANKHKAGLLSALKRTDYGQEETCKEYYMILVTVGAYQETIGLYYLDYNQLFAEVGFSDRVQATLGETEFWIVDGKGEMEKIIFVDSKQKDCATLAKKMYRELQCMNIPFTLTFEVTPIPLERINETYRNLRKYIDQNMIFCRSSFLISSGSSVEKDGVNDGFESIIKLVKGETFSFYRDKLNELFDLSIRRPIKHRHVTQATKLFFFYLSEHAPLIKEYPYIEERVQEIFQCNYQVERIKDEFVYLLRECMGEVATDSKDKDELARKVKEYLDRNYRHNITNQIIGEKFCLVPSYLSSIFKSKYHITLGDYLIQCRIEEAKKLLMNSSMKVKEISEYLGYHDPLYFSKAFKKVVGMSPSEFLNQEKTG